MRAKAAILSGLLLTLAALAVACGGGDSWRLSGVPQVDAVVKAVLSGDEQALRGFVRYTPIACTTGPLEFGGPPECLPGESDGTIVGAILVASCEGHYVRPDGINEALDYLLAGKPKLYGVYKASPAGTSGDYTAIFSVEGSEVGQVEGKELVIQGAEIVWIDFGCGTSPEQMAQEFEQQPSPTPTPTSGGG